MIVIGRYLNNLYVWVYVDTFHEMGLVWYDEVDQYSWLNDVEIIICLWMFKVLG